MVKNITYAKFREALASLGILHVSAGYMFMRSGIQANLSQAIGEWVAEAYAGGPVLASGIIGPARYLPKSRRQRGYAALMSLAAPLGIEVSISSATNPDFCSQLSARPLESSLPLLPRFEATDSLIAQCKVQECKLS